MKYILASASPRRKELLSRLHIPFEIEVSNADETITQTDPADIVKELSKIKAEGVFSNHTDESITVIGADTIVVYRDEILGKPEDEEDAFAMLSMLADRTHQVFTGVTIISRKEGKKKTVQFYEKTSVTFYPVDAFDLKDYIATKDPMDKAGAYGIQGDFSIHIKKIDGDYNNVVGLPIARLYQELKKM